MFIKIAGILSVLIALYSFFPYIQAVLSGKTRPHLLSWFIFTIMNGMVFFAQVFVGGGLSTLISLTNFIYALIILLLAVGKRGSKTNTIYDFVLFTFALTSMIFWILTKNNDLAIWLTLFIDLAATTMIGFKVYRLPNSESALPWFLGTLAYVFSCITLYHIPFGILYLRPIYGLVCDAALVFIIYFFDNRSKTRLKNKIST